VILKSTRKKKDIFSYQVLKWYFTVDLFQNNYDIPKTVWK
jgi:hypothetical protein